MGRAVLGTPVFSHRPFTNDGATVYRSKVDTAGDVVTRRMRIIPPRWIAGGRDVWQPGDAPIQKTNYLVNADHPTGSIALPAFQPGDQGTWWILVRWYGGDVETLSWHCARRIVLDSQLNEVKPVPNPVVPLDVEVRAGGVLRVRWLYDRTGEAVAPSVFRIFDNQPGGGAVDYATIVASEPYAGTRLHTAEIAYAHGTTVTFGIRAESAAGGREQNTATLSGTADAQGPPAVTAIKTASC